MESQPTMILETGAAALLFAAVFLVGGKVHPVQSLVRDRRTVVSFGAGMAAAYVFVRVMPELQGAREAMVESASMTLRYEGMAIYFLALLGFLSFYGLDHLRLRLERSAEAKSKGESFRLQVGGFAVYVWLMAYLLVRNIEETRVSIGAYAIAISFHFLGIDHELRRIHGAAYDRKGRVVLAGMVAAGWGFGLLVAFPPVALTMLIAFVSGAVIINSAIMELPADKDGRVVPFLSGGIIYGLILLPLG